MIKNYFSFCPKCFLSKSAKSAVLTGSLVRKVPSVLIHLSGAKNASVKTVASAIFAPVGQMSTRAFCPAYLGHCPKFSCFLIMTPPLMLLCCKVITLCYLWEIKINEYKLVNALIIFKKLTLVNAGGGAIIILCRKIAISPQPNIRSTWDQSVNSSLSVVVQ